MKLLLNFSDYFCINTLVDCDVNDSKDIRLSIMQQLTKNMSGRWRDLPVVSVLFFGAFFLFVRFFIETKFVYYYFEMSCKSPFFKTGWDFLQECLSYPGGPSGYLAAFLIQLCFYPWIGAAVIILIAYGFYILTASLIFPDTKNSWRVLFYLPSLLILLICCRYENPFGIGVPILAIIFLCLVHQKISPRTVSLRIILFSFLCGVGYYVSGFACLVFIVFAVLNEFINKRKPALHWLYLLLGPVICLALGRYIFRLDLNELYIYANPFLRTAKNLEKERWARTFETALFVFLPAVFLLNIVKNKLEGKKTFEPLSNFWFRLSLQTMILIVIAVPSVLFSFDLRAKRTLGVCYFAHLRMWPEALDTAQKGSLKRYYPFCNNAVNQALYFTGRMGDEMFTFPQNFHSSDLIFCNFMQGNIIHMTRAELCLDLGLVNTAEKLACEFLSLTDDSPYIIKQLALINIVKGEIESAKVCLGALSKNLIYAKEAKNLLRRLEMKQKLNNDDRMNHLRSIMINKDETFISYNEDNWLQMLLSSNRKNKMAFEYLMAHYLLSRQLDKFIENLPRLNDFGYERMPRHYQEALLIYLGTGGRNISADEVLIDTDILETYNKINKIGQTLNGNIENMKKTLEPNFGNTYFFYHTFGYTILL